MGDRAGRLTRRSLLSGAIGLGVTGALPLLLVSADLVGKRQLQHVAKLMEGAMPRPLTAVPAYGFPDPAGATGSGLASGEPSPFASAQTGATTGVPAQTGATTGVPAQTGAAQQPTAMSRVPLGTAPLVHSREEWNAEAPRQPAVLLMNAPDHIVIHNTDTPNSTDLSLQHAFKLSRQIQRFHMNYRGWDDIGEQLTISRGGYVMEGRNQSLTAIMAGRNVMGSQTLSQNDHTIGIENEGSYMVSQVPAVLWASLVQVCAWLCQEYDLNPYRAIVGHRDYVDYTNCPGDVLYARLPELRRTVAQGLLARRAGFRRPSAAIQQNLPRPR